jgi:hypothetical protein
LKIKALPFGFAGDGTVDLGEGDGNGNDHVVGFGSVTFA